MKFGGILETTFPILPRRLSDYGTRRDSLTFFSPSRKTNTLTTESAPADWLWGLATKCRYRDWQTGLPPHGIKVAGVCFVNPDHPAPPPEALLLDPSVVFGDGSHPTTNCCLGFMEEIIRAELITSMLDLGTGSGILALAAARMGVKRVLAVDRNRLAVRTARENVKVNALDAVIRVQEGEARLFIDQPFDLVTANLPFHVLRELIPLKGSALHRFWIVSGINEQQGETLKELFSDLGYETCRHSVDHPWVTFTTARRCSIE